MSGVSRHITACEENYLMSIMDFSSLNRKMHEQI